MRLIRMFLCCLALGGVFVPGIGQAQEVILRLHHFLPPMAPAHADYLQPWAERVGEQSGGRIEVQIYPAMQLGGGPPALFDQAREGVVDLVWTLTGYTPDRFPKSEVFDLPFLPVSAEATSQAAYEFYQSHLLDEFEDVHVLMVHTHGPGLLHVKGDGIRTLDDLEGLRLRGPTRMTTRLLQALGASPVGMPVPQVPEALSRGVIDGTILPWEVTRPLRVAELVDSHTNFSGDRGLYTTLFVFAMNKAAYDGLPGDLRAVIDANSGIAEAREMGRVMDAADAPAYDLAESRGNALIVLDEAETVRWREASEAVVAAWTAEMDERGLDGEGLVRDAVALVEKYADAP